MRLLVVTPFLPTADAGHGSAVYLHALTGAMAALAEVRIVSFASAAEGMSGLTPSGCRVVRVPRRSNRDLESLAARLTGRVRTAWHFAAGRPIAVAKFRDRAMSAAIRAAILEDAPDAVLIEMTVMGQYLADCGQTPTVLTDHEAATPIPARVFPLGIGARRERRNWERYFGRVLAAPDLLQALNEVDAGTLARRCGRQVGVRPVMVPIPANASAPESAAPRLLFLGDYDHHPNREAAIHLAREILPRVRQRVPAAVLVLAGAHPTTEVRSLSAVEGVSVTGFVENLSQLLGSGRALVAPLFSGDGSRIKVLTALAHGLPVVANALAARGIAAPAPALSVTESAEAMSERCVELLLNRELCADAGRAGRRWAEQHVSAERVARDQCDAIAAMITRTRGAR